MSVKGGGSTFSCTSGDTKPTTGLNAGALCIETDTRKLYTWNGSSWAEFTGSGGGGGGSGDSFLRKTADQQITAAGFVDISGLTFAVDAGQPYHFEGFVIFQSSATTCGALFAVNGPASPTLLAVRSMKQVTTPGTASTDMYSEATLTAYDTPLPNSTAEPAANTNLIWHVVGTFVPSASGTFALRFSKENVAGTITVKAHSWLRYRAI